MKLGLSLGYWGKGQPPGQAEQLALAEELGYDSVWTAEAYGSDALTPLAWLGASTSRIKLGTGIVQMSARTPTATAMAAMTLDHLSGGRVLLGLGVSGPQVVEGWYGQPYPRPLARTREYFEVLRQTIARERVEHDGAQIQIPYVDKYGMKSTGLGKALRSTLHPVRDQIPLLLAAEGPKNIALSAEIADGWLPFFYSPWDADFAHTALEEGFARRAPERLPRDQFEIACPVQVIVSDDLEAAADWIRPFIALYVGGMGAKGANFHFDAVARLGYEEVCAKIQDLYLEGRKDEATAAVPLDLVEKIALIGPKEKIRDDLAAWSESVVTTLMVGGDADTLRMMAELVL
ncbi:LLM class F420-dependent oxidoreductase [Aeromicrobium sp. Marseille-Q0843]|uniref:LLM class F420-dependent oxidoreductase n=1 Tax=Aeromicrobium phoceense TaxID=2754045 RepID=A0A838XML9_9ACTN|nr:LLM class F420-dependent oxidoreductase [Aeromicrobium phoceense]MBA4608100.1 LLM class F420-dependent oxidoreductase [Aeromicrobium phoceense]